MKINHCAVYALKKIEANLPKVDLDEEESHKLKSLGMFFLLAVVVTFLNRIGR